MTDEFLIISSREYSGSYTDAFHFNGNIRRHRNDESNSGAALLDTTHSPIALWQFDGDILDSSGNGKDLVVATGATQFVAGPVVGTQAMFFDGSTVLSRSGQVDSDLNFDGLAKEFTVQMIIKPIFYPNAIGDNERKYMNVLRCDTTGSGHGVTKLYDIKLNRDETIYGNHSYFLWESGSATGGPILNISRQFTAWRNNEWQHLAFVKDRINASTGGIRIRYYLDGEFIGDVPYLDGTVTDPGLGPNLFDNVGQNPTEGTGSWVTVGGATDLSNIDDIDVSGSYFSGSISCIKIVGSVLTDDEIKAEYERVFKPIQNTKKYGGSKVNRRTVGAIGSPGPAASIIPPTINRMDFNKVRQNGKFDFRYSEVIPFVSGAALGKSNNFIQLTSEETFWDSLMPSPVEYHVANGAEPLLIERGFRKAPILSETSFPNSSSFALPIIGRGLDPDFITRTPGAGVQSNTYISGGATEILAGDTLWGYMFPFENKYRELKRLKKPSYVLDKDFVVKVSDSGSYMPIPWTADVVGGGGVAASDSDGVLNTPVNTNLFNGMLCILSKIFDPGGAAASNGVEEASIRALIDLTTDNVSTLQIGSLVPSDFVMLSNFELVMVPSLIDTYKFYFGTGRKYGHTANSSFLGDVITTIDGSPGSVGGDGQALAGKINGQLKAFFIAGVQVAGWKYGVYNPIPSKSRVTYRRDRYGQFRDMLEQRLVTKYRLNIKDTITSGPVKVRFVSGSNAAVTASNPTTLNPNSSGIYDREYAAGRPFIED